MDEKTNRKVNVKVGGDVGQGCGCLMVAIAIGILFNFDRVLDIIEKAVS